MKKFSQLIFFLFFLNVFIVSNASTINWMSQIPDDRVLNQLIIPGTHASGTSSITKDSYFSYDNKSLPSWLQSIANIIPHSILRGVLANWSKAQPYSINQQLNQGIRYFDFNVCKEQPFGNDDDFYLCNNMVSEKLSKAMEDIVVFVLANPSEYVIVNINHVYGVDDIFKQTSLISMLDAILFNVDVPNSITPDSTMGEIRKTGRHIILYMNPMCDLEKPVKPNWIDFEKHYLWHSDSINISPSKSDLSALKQTMDASVAFRANTFNTSKQFFVLQATRAVSASNVVDGILSQQKYPGNVESYAKSVNQSLTEWLKDYVKKYHATAINIITQDWFTDGGAIVSLAMQYDAIPNNLLKNSDVTNDNFKNKLLQLSAKYHGNH